MPFSSKAQQRYMHAKHPKIAKRWDKETPDFEDLPEKKGMKPKEKVGFTRRMMGRVKDY